MNEQAKNLEQLYYTWFSDGLSKQGWGVRAATPPLQDVESTRFRAIDPYLRYNPPADANPYTLSPDQAPLCLAFIKAGNDTILVHKKFIGRDRYARAGNYFIHALVGLPPHEFTSREAVQLWQATDLWKTSDQHLKELQVDLGPEPLAHLKQQSTASSMTLGKTAQDYLPYVIQAFLTLLRERQQAPVQVNRAAGKQRTSGPLLAQPVRKPKEQLYIAAPPDVVAQIIWGLTCVLRQEWVETLTFSTYEQDVTSSDATIVGTCLMSTLMEGISAGDVLDWKTYPKAYVINCYQGGGCSPLTTEPQLLDFANIATRYVAEGDLPTLEEFLSDAPRISTVDQFVTDFIRWDNNRQTDFSSEAIIDFLQHPSGQSKLLVQQRNRLKTKEVLMDASWWNRGGKAIVERFRKTAIKQPELRLEKVCALLADSITDALGSAIAQPDGQRIAFLPDVLQTLDPPEPTSRRWVDLAHKIPPDRPPRVPLEQRALLLDIWSRVFFPASTGASPVSSEMPRSVYPWLEVPWGELPQLFALKLHEQMKAVAVHTLLREERTPFPANLSDLVETHYTLFAGAAGMMLDSNSWQATIHFFAHLAQPPSPFKMRLLQDVLASQQQVMIVHAAQQQQMLVRHEARCIALLKAAHLNANNLKMLLDDPKLQPLNIEQGMIHALLDDQNWWNPEASQLIRDSQEREAKNKVSSVRPFLRQLSVQAANRALPLLKGKKEQDASFFLSVMETATPPQPPVKEAVALLNQPPDAWGLLRAALPPAEFSQLSAPLQFRLFRCWVKADFSLASLPLPSLTWELVPAFLTLNLPLEILRISLFPFLREASALPPARFSQDVLPLVEKQHTLFEPLLLSLPSNRAGEALKEGLRVALDFFDRLAGANYSRTMPLLYTLLDSPDLFPHADTLLSSARLRLPQQRANRVELLENHSSRFLQGAFPAAEFMALVVYYLKELNPEQDSTRLHEKNFTPVLELFQRLQRDPHLGRTLENNLKQDYARLERTVFEKSLDALQRPDDTRVYFWLRLLAIYAPPASSATATRYWLDEHFWGYLSTYIPRDPVLRDWLLTTLLPSLKDQHNQPVATLDMMYNWFLKMPWEHYDGILALPLPDDWKEALYRGFIGRFSKRISAEQHRFVVKHYQGVEAQLAWTMEGATWRAYGVDFFGVLAIAGYHRKLPLLNMLLAACIPPTPSPEEEVQLASQTEALLQAAHLIPAEQENFLNTFNWPYLPPTMVQWADAYLHRVSIHQLLPPQPTSQPIRWPLLESLLPFIGTENFATTPQLPLYLDLWNTILGWQRANADIQYLATLLNKLPPDEIARIRESIEVALVLWALTSKELLKETLLTLGPVVEESGLNLLNKLVQLTNFYYPGDRNARKVAKLFPYLQFILTEPIPHKNTEKPKDVVKRLLDTLLAGVPPQERDAISQQVKGWGGQASGAWNRYLHPNKTFFKDLSFQAQNIHITWRFWRWRFWPSRGKQPGQPTPPPQAGLAQNPVNPSRKKTERFNLFFKLGVTVVCWLAATAALLAFSSNGFTEAIPPVYLWAIILLAVVVLLLVAEILVYPWPFAKKQRAHPR